MVGAGILAPHAGEMISQWTLAIAQRTKLSALAGLIVPYPTRSEAAKRAAGSAFAATLFSTRTKWVVRCFPAAMTQAGFNSTAANNHALIDGQHRTSGGASETLQSAYKSMQMASSLTLGLRDCRGGLEEHPASAPFLAITFAYARKRQPRGA